MARIGNSPLGCVITGFGRRDAAQLFINIRRQADNADGRLT
jgi:hypothetical protein